MNPKRTLPELRRQIRQVKKARASLYWDDGHSGPQFTHGDCLNISESGMRLQLQRRVPSGSAVHVRLDTLGFAAFGVVKHSDERGIIGIELRHESIEPEQAARWKALLEAAERDNRRPKS